MSQPSALAELLPYAVADCLFTAHSRKRLLQRAAEIVDGAAPASALSADDLFDHLMERERLGSTALEHGVAIPHCRVSCDQVKLAIITLREAIDYESLDGAKTDIFFVLVVPETEKTRHLTLLAEISAICSDQANRIMIRNCQTDADLLRLFEQLSAADADDSKQAGSRSV
ncbi:MAG TPA: hypothetical protein DER02_03285 [Gammaproteobacteria bacterium]|mgnify:CR=1 FL=1|nr:hypothetical protein [Gammaproteobacteria bacterium]|tara:strand:+ start:5823 stop:6335 length:513 start_codon:yes stop_codon:yes gene_type:complete